VTKVYIIASWGSGKTIHDSFRRLTPSNSGRWGTVELCDNFDEANYYIALWCDAPPLIKKCRPSSVINVMLESSGRIPSANELGAETIYSQWVTETHNPVDWWVSKSYSELVASPFPDKTKLITSITTGRYISKPRIVLRPFLLELDKLFPSILKRFPKRIQRGWKIGREGHHYRLRFLKDFSKKYPGTLDLYGQNVGGYDLTTISGYKGPLKDKWEGLAPYRYAFAFENTSEKNYFTEKFTDCVLAGCMPIYWGCKNMRDYFQKNSFVELDITRRDAVDEAMRIIQTDHREQNLEALKRAKDLILNKYQFWPTIEEIIKKLEKREMP
jgi:hypothetical protein